MFKTGGAIVELEERYKIFDQAGKLRLGAFANRGRTGNYNEALAIAASDPSVDINAAIPCLDNIAMPGRNFVFSIRSRLTAKTISLQKFVCIEINRW